MGSYYLHSDLLLLQQLINTKHILTYAIFILISLITSQLTSDNYSYHFMILILSLLIIARSAQPQNPVIGIYTQNSTNSQTKGRLYIAASYVKFLQMSGCQVVPIIYTDSQAKLQSQLEQINGVLFPGGDQAIAISNTWTKNADFILKYAIEQNKQGKVFPIWAACLGHELLSYLTANYDSNVLQSVSGQSPIVNKLQILNKSSHIFNNWSPKHFETVTTGHGILYFSHVYAVYTKYFNASSSLTGFWNLVAKTTSSANQEFVSAMEAKQYPFYSVQFHAEKNPFEWKVDANRTAEGIQVTQLLSNNYAAKARLNPNRFLNDSALQNSLIYNYKTFRPNSQSSFQEIYLFS